MMRKRTEEAAEAAEAAEEFKILIATDNHLGYLEEVPKRGNDSFRTFDEILSLGNDLKVDMVLLGGDLFHDSNPSRECLHRTMQILRNRCMGGRPVNITFESDPGAPVPKTWDDEKDEEEEEDGGGGDNGNSYGYDEADESRTSKKRKGKNNSYINTCTPLYPNFSDPNYNVSLPVYTIHGNHDNPTGKDAGLSALDLLADANLINYFGKTHRVDEIVIPPVLLRKGGTKVALYGLGSIRDERLHRTIKYNKLSFLFPDDSGDDGDGDGSGGDDWFKIFVVHHNRVKHRSEDYFPQEKIPKKIDFVLWGHEHECKITPTPVYEDHTFVTQPGASVAVALTEGESGKKNVGLLSIKGKNFKFETIELKSVRPFVYDRLTLSAVLDNEENDLEKIESVIKKKVDSMIEKASHSSPNFIPLIRLRVDNTGFKKLVPATFGKQYIGKVANSNEILAFTERATTKAQSISVLMATGADARHAYVDAGLQDDPSLASVDDPLERRILSILSKDIAGMVPKVISRRDFIDAVSSNHADQKPGRKKKDDDVNKFTCKFREYFNSIVKKCRQGTSVQTSESELAWRVELAVKEIERQNDETSVVGAAVGNYGLNNDDDDDDDYGMDNTCAASGYGDEESLPLPPPPKKKAHKDCSASKWPKTAIGGDGGIDSLDDGAIITGGYSGSSSVSLSAEPKKTQKSSSDVSKKAPKTKKQQLQLPFKKAQPLSQQQQQQQQQLSRPITQQQQQGHSILGKWGMPNRK